MRNQNLVKKLMILPKNINDKEYIKGKIYEKEKKCDLEGYIDKIHKINKVTFHKFYEQNFLGSILINIDFNADIVNLDIGDVLECKIVKADEDGLIAKGIYPIFIVIDNDYEKLSFINIGDIVKVEILKKEICMKKNIIKAVAKYIDKTELNDKKLNNTETLIEIYK